MFAKEAQRHKSLRLAASNAMALSPTILLQRMQIERPLDVMKATALLQTRNGQS